MNQTEKTLNLAITGISFKLPGASQLDTLWDNIAGRKNCTGQVPRERWNIPDYYSPVVPSPGKTYSKICGCIDNARMFDPAFFDIKEDEASLIPPGQRLFLEAVKELLETNGYGGKKLWGKDVGVFVGAPSSPYYYFPETAANIHANGMQNTFAMIANSVSHFFNFQGPSVVLDTICSSAFVALHSACRSITNGECSQAVVGGINIIPNADHFILLSQMQVLSPTGKTKTFSSEADGFVLGEGVGALLIKPLENALNDGDRILGVIKASGVNHNGNNTNKMTPDARSVSKLLVDTWQTCSIDPESISYFEVNGSGTSLGDAIEYQGILEAFSSCTGKKDFCALGSIKPLIGNLETASGIAGIAKVLACFKNKKIPPAILDEPLNPLIKLQDSPFYIPPDNLDWKNSARPMRAGLNLLGIGGTNAHIVLEEPPAPATSDAAVIDYQTETEEHLLCLSAKNSKDLIELCKKYKEYLSETGDINLTDFCCTHNTGRTVYGYKAAFLFSRLDSLLALFDDFIEDYEKQGKIITRSGPIFYSPAEVRAKETFKKKKSFLKNFLSVFAAKKASSASQIPIVVCYPENSPESGDYLLKTFQEYNLKKVQKISFSSAADSEFLDWLQQSDSASYKSFILCGADDETSGRIKNIIINGSLFTLPASFDQEKNALTMLWAALFSHGADLDFELLYSDKKYRKTYLPPYPLHRSSYWNTRDTKVVTQSIPEDIFALSGKTGLSAIQEKLEQSFCALFEWLLGIDASKTDISAPFEEYNLESIQIIKIIRLIENRLKIALQPEDFYDRNTIAAISAYLAELIDRKDNQTEEDKKSSPSREQKITLKKADQDDYPFFQECINDKEIHQMLDSFFHDSISLREYSFFLRKKDKQTFIIKDEKNKSVGIAGFVNIDQSNKSAETWIVVSDRVARARGLAVSAANLLCLKGFTELDLHSLIAKIREDNESSLEMARHSKWRFAGILEDWITYEQKSYSAHIFQLKKADIIQ